jgi:zeaxanthin glucosyltransferase
MKIGFISPFVPGHFNPMTALARQVQARHHEVVYLALPVVEPLVRAIGLPFASFGQTESLSALTENVKSLLARLSKLQGEDASRMVLQIVAGWSEIMWHSLPDILMEEGIDALVLDTYLFYAELVPMRLGLPYMHVSNALPFDYSGYTPLCLYGWPHETNSVALARNRGGVARFAGFLAEANAGIRAHAERAGLDVDWENPGSTISKLAWLTQIPREFDFESSNWPSQFHYTGPFHDGAGRVNVEFPWEQLTGEPIVYASMGTVANGRPEIFRAIVSAVAKHRDLQLVLSIGNQIDRDQVGPAPSNSIIVRQAPQLELLQRSSVCITHAGLNTVLEALTQGVPQVAIPVAHDQPGVAARIAHKQTGLVTSLDKLTAPRLSALLGEVLGDYAYHSNARRIQQAIARNNGLSQAADLIEQCFGLTKPASESFAQTKA